MCECVDKPNVDHGCCHQENIPKTSSKSSCSDVPHLCFLNPTDVDLVVRAVASDLPLFKSIGVDGYSLVRPSFFNFGWKRQTASQYYQTETLIKDFYHLSEPTRGPPLTAA